MTIPPRVVSDMDVFGVPAPTARFVEVVYNQIERDSFVKDMNNNDKDCKNSV